MTLLELEAFAAAPYEDKLHEVKGPIAWSQRCFKGEVLCDIAALANSGGGVVLIGRDSPRFRNGSLSLAEQGAYDVSNVGTDIRNHISTTLRIVVHPVRLGTDLVVAVDVGPSLRAPAIMLQAFNCGPHGPIPHFNAGDVYIRTDAAQTRRLSSFPEIEDLFNRIVDYRVTEEILRIKTLGLF